MMNLLIPLRISGQKSAFKMEALRKESIIIMKSASAESSNIIPLPIMLFEL